jgi:hypothetical protein
MFGALIIYICAGLNLLPFLGDLSIKMLLLDNLNAASFFLGGNIADKGDGIISSRLSELLVAFTSFVEAFC